MRPNDPEWMWRYIGGAYKWRGRVPTHAKGEGVDCWGANIWIARHEFNRVWNDYGEAYPADGKAGAAQAEVAMTANFHAWRPVEWEEGAGVLFRVAGRPVHCGIATAQRRLLVHAHPPVVIAGTLRSPGGVNFLDLTQSPKWESRFAGCFLPVD